MLFPLLAICKTILCLPVCWTDAAERDVDRLAPDLIESADKSKMLNPAKKDNAGWLLASFYDPLSSVFDEGNYFFYIFRLRVNPTADISDDILAHFKDEVKAVIESNNKWHLILSNHFDWDAPDSVKDFSFDPVTRKMRINGQFKGFGNEKQKLTAKLSNQFYLALSPPYFQG
eukprot:GHVT01104240.1.p1 GENE.GHVT01104240.1~~GHVT01104240.1.p1  ORF type:complete len:173 (-),score=19.82 GHVT01104240.1:1287-1805(-)